MELISSAEIKKGLKTLPKMVLEKMIMRLARLKKENKELLHFELRLNGDADQYKEEVWEEIKSYLDTEFSGIRLQMKALKRANRLISKYGRLSQVREGEAELIIRVIKLVISDRRTEIKRNIIQRFLHTQLKKAYSLSRKFHPDLKYDLEAEIMVIIEDLKDLKGWDSRKFAFEFIQK